MSATVTLLVLHVSAPSILNYVLETVFSLMSHVCQGIKLDQWDVAAWRKSPTVCISHIF